MSPLRDIDVDALIEDGHVDEIDDDKDRICRELVAQQLVALSRLSPANRGQILAMQDAIRRLTPHIHGFIDVKRLPLDAWILASADSLGAPFSDDVRAQIGTPCNGCLAAVRGIGSRRLDTLYAAGFHQASQLAEANPLEVATVTGFTRTLSRSLVAAARNHLGLR